MSAVPNYIVTTGDFIAEWMGNEGVNAAELARRLNVTPKHVSELLNGIAPLSHQLALGLERVTGVPARIWNNYESGYRDDLARRAEKNALEAQYERAQSFPLTYLRKFGYISAQRRDKAETVRQLLTILGVASLTAFDSTWQTGNVAYRRVAITSAHAPELTTWLALGEREYDRGAETPPFSRNKLELLVPQLRPLTAKDDVLTSIEVAVERLHDAGVLLCFIPPIPGLGIHGATRWINDHPIIQLSLRGRTDDQLWFTLFHEIGHVLLHSKKGLFLEGDTDTNEVEADEYAARTLIPPDYRARLPRNRNLAAVTDLAHELGIAPSIVLGQAQRITGDYAWGQTLKRRFSWEKKTHG